jgi:glycosyltransferase involved in cell wall biosynthesis
MPAPRLFLDIQTIQSQHAADRGIPRFATELSRALLADGAPVAGLALNPLAPWPRRIHAELARAPQLTWNTAVAFRRALAAGPLVYVVVSPFELSRPVQAVLGAHVTGVPRVAVVHDLIPHLFPGLFDLDETALGRVYARRIETLRSFDLLLTPSASTRRDVITRLGVPPNGVTVVGEAASPLFVPPQPGDDPRAAVRRAVPAINRPFVLCVSASEAHKNTESLIEAWARLEGPVRDEYQLVIACSVDDETRRSWTAVAARQGIAPDKLVFTGFVEDEVLRALYQSAELFVLPSRYEGFGLPILEAVSCGCPAISSNTSSLPELLDWPDATFAPGEPDEIAALIDRALTDASYRAELLLRSRRVAGRHSWSRVVERVLSSCAPLSDDRPARARRLRVALVGPFPPNRSWIAGLNAQLADHLGGRCDLDCFSEPFNARNARPSRSRCYRMFPGAALGPTLTPAAYDAVLYSIGPEPDDAYRLCRGYPGIVWLHDLALASADLLTGARGVIVDSEDARSALLGVVGASRSGVPIWVIPPPISDADATRASNPLGDPPTSFGDVAERVVEIAGLDLEPSRPLEAPPPVSAPAA